MQTRFTFHRLLIGITKLRLVRRHFHFCRSTVVILALLFLQQVEIATSVLAVENKELADYVIDGMQNNRAKLHTCQVDVQIKLKRTSDDAESNTRISDVSIAQDFDKNFMRFDRTEKLTLSNG